MNLSRRNALRFMAGSAAALAAAGGGGAWWLNRRAERAIAPWAAAGSGMYDDWRMKALAYAVLAPSPHNRQPWLLDLVGVDDIRVYCELDRRLPATDPFDRQTVIGFGCFLETLRMAAAQDGAAVQVAAFPEGLPDEQLDHRPVALVRRVEGAAAPDPLFAHVLDRHTSREAYRAELVSPEALDVLAAAVPDAADYRAHTGLGELAALRELTVQAFDLETHVLPVHEENIPLMRIGRAEMDANPDGLALDGPVVEFARLVGLVSHKSLADPESATYRRAVDKMLADAAASPAYVSLSTDGNSRQDQLDSGRDWMRLQLAATGQGLSMQPMSQALQEYAQMDEVFAELHRMLRPQGGRVQMLARMGYGPAQRPAPRWPLQDRILPA